MALYKNLIYSFCIFLSLQFFSLTTKSSAASIELQTNPKVSQDIPEPAGPGTPGRSVPGGTFVRFEPPANLPGLGVPSRGGEPSVPPDFGVPNRGAPSVQPQDYRCEPATLLLPFGNIGLTVSEYPTFFVGVTRYAKNGIFTLQDENGKTIYEISIPLNENLGVFAINLPKTGPGLEIGKYYSWSFILVYSPTLQGMAEGVISRIEIDRNLQEELAEANSLERAVLYAKNGIWFDTLSTLADEIRRQEPNNKLFVNEWQQLLNSEGLRAVSQMPLN
ncbi:MAG TPA: DUF928 domain-containing protein [Halomicronema sp.]